MKNFLNDIKREMQTMGMKDIGFKLAPLYQNIESEYYQGFQQDIKEHNYTILAYTDDEITIFLNPSTPYCYKIRFGTIDVWNDYCQCQPTDEGYNDVYECCGEKCDYLNSDFQLLKVYSIGYNQFKGQAKDLWKTIEEIEGEDSKQREIEEKKRQLQMQIEKLQKQLDHLNN